MSTERTATATTSSAGVAGAAAAAGLRSSTNTAPGALGGQQQHGGCGDSSSQQSRQYVSMDEATYLRCTADGGGGGADNCPHSYTFLRAVKKVQLQNRMLKLRKVKSARGSVFGDNSSGGRWAAAVAAARVQRNKSEQPTSERTPLTVGSIDENKEEDGSSPLTDEEEIAKQENKGAEEGGGGDDEEEEKITTMQALKDIVFGKPVSVCLAAVPFALWAQYGGWNDTWIFWLNFLVMIPLAAILGDFTEELALYTNETIGGLINATFGNAVEVVVGIQALLAKEIRVVQASMLGSIFSNLLLVLGCCFFFGGLYHKEQKFNAIASTANMGLLALSSVALVLPTPFSSYYDLHDEHVLIVSRTAAVFLMVMYVEMLVFQLYTHTHVFEGGGDAEELAIIPFWVAVVGLLVTTLLVAVFSEFLVDSIGGFTEASGVSRTFVGIILLPIVGNAVEHVTAVSVAVKDKMDLAMGVAVGSCTQISLFVVPLMVLVGWATGEDMTLNFPHFEIILYVLSVFTVSVILAYPFSNWLEGSLLITTYCLIAVGFWFENVKQPPTAAGEEL